MISSVVILLGEDGEVKSRRPVLDTKTFASRTYRFMGYRDWEEKADQLIDDLLNERSPVIQHPINAQRLEFLLID